MRHYLVFFIIIIAVIVSYEISPYFVQHRYVQPVKNIDLPKLVNKRHFSDSDILLSAVFRKKSIEIASKHAERPVVLNMIYYENGKKVCKIDGNIFKEGEYCKGIRVLKIEKDRVLIKTKKYRRWLVLNVYANKKS